MTCLVSTIYLDITKNKPSPPSEIGETNPPSLSDPTLSVLRLQIGLSLQLGLPAVGCVFSKPKFSHTIHVWYIYLHLS